MFALRKNLEISRKAMTSVYIKIICLRLRKQFCALKKYFSVQENQISDVVKRKLVTREKLGNGQLFKLLFLMHAEMLTSSALFYFFVIFFLHFSTFHDVSGLKYRLLILILTMLKIVESPSDSKNKRFIYYVSFFTTGVLYCDLLIFLNNCNDNNRSFYLFYNILC